MDAPGWAGARRLVLSVAGLMLLSSASCILPPDADEARHGSTFLASQELSLVTHLKRGSDFALAGRADLAEAEYRKAIKIRPDLATPLSDLGFVLLQQERDEEAAAVLKRAIELQPDHVVAHENLGRALYRVGDSAGAAQHFQTALNILAGSSPDRIREITGRRFDPSEIGAIHRNLAISYLASGVLDEAICNSKEALTIANNLDEAGTHGRLLISLGMLDAAAKLYSDTIAVWQTQVPPKMFFDYGLTLYARGQLDLAQEIFGKVLESRNTDREDRNVTHVMRLLLARKAGNSVEAQSIHDGLLEEEPELCTRLQVDPNRYWPYQVVEDVSALMKELCPEQAAVPHSPELVTNPRVIARAAAAPRPRDTQAEPGEGPAKAAERKPAVPSAPAVRIVRRSTTPAGKGGSAAKRTTVQESSAKGAAGAQGAARTRNAANRSASASGSPARSTAGKSSKSSAAKSKSPKKPAKAVAKQRTKSERSPTP